MRSSKQDVTRPEKNTNPVSAGRHKANCTVCSHEKCAEIEMEFVAWKSPALIVTEYGLADRTSICRHANALGLPGRFRAVDGVCSTASEIEQKEYDLGKSRRAKFGRVRQHKMEGA